MLDCGITTYILAIIWLFSFLMIIAALNTGRSSGRTTLIIATIITAFFRFVPVEYFHEVADSFRRNLYIIVPVTVTSIIGFLIIGYIYLFSYLCRYQPKNPPPKVKESSDTD